MDPWIHELKAGRLEAAWDAFLERYRRLLFATIRHYVEDHDDVMDVFTRVCEALREDDLRRLRAYTAESAHRARFSTWLVAVVRNLTVDWIRGRYGRPRPSASSQRLSPLQRRIFELVFTRHRSHAEAYELIRSRDDPQLAFGAFLKELAAVYRAVTAGRGRLPRELTAQPAPEAAVEADDPLPATEAREILADALNALPAADRAAVQMYVVDELPAAEVARILGLANAKAVYNRVYRAMAVVRERLEGAGVGREDL